ncbi:NAD(P)-dependent alcohol dehydrogenase [Arthrobacter sp. MA-N2]|uniref:NAD(P)-dependent alcohol dehydrogenase n=1 Tax=Arthrobacter sp. MA-N2 TaxID=1101188 RepID=UPI0004B8666D|nr:NAD(P)-dependent alcohol dehydrogenase [Arthrobacter sp. MA-N2]
MTSGQHVSETQFSDGPSAPEPRMRAIVQEAYGPADVLHLAQIPRAKIAGNEVLIRVHAAGLDRGTWHVTRGLPYAVRLAYGLRAPRNPVPGMDLAGTVVAVGAEVTRFAAGDHVFGVGKGSFAEYATARENQLARKPKNISFEQAAVVPVSGCTALQALRAATRILPGQKVLILGASGGVGSYAVQLAKASGAEVTGVCSTAKMDAVRGFGADHVIDYTKQDFADGTGHYELILDVAGNPTLARLRSALTPTGTAVIIGGEEGGSWTGSIDRQFRGVALSLFIRQGLTMVLGTQGPEDLEHLAGLIESGVLTPVVDRIYPLEQVPEAMRYFDAGRTRGKIAITI